MSWVVDFYEADGWMRIYQYQAGYRFESFEAAKSFCTKLNRNLDPENQKRGEHWSVIEEESQEIVYSGYILVEIDWKVVGIDWLLYPKQEALQSNLADANHKKQCISCGTSLNITLHHALFKSQFPKFANSKGYNTAPMCKVCHKNLHEGNKNLEIKALQYALIRCLKVIRKRKLDAYGNEMEKKNKEEDR